LGCYVIGRAGHWYVTHQADTPNDYWGTLMFVYMFILGALLAKHAKPLGERWRRLGSYRRLGWMLVAVLMYAYQFWVPVDYRGLAMRILGDFPTALAVSIFIIAALNSGRVTSPLLNPLVVLLGKVSYSLYLLHGVILMTLVRLFYGEWPLMLIMAAVIPLSLFAAVASYYVFEQPSIKLGKYLSGVWGRTI
jgi:peptidoglycan/LPS O-acetylase OafA/YrhL